VPDAPPRRTSCPSTSPPDVLVYGAFEPLRGRARDRGPRPRGGSIACRDPSCLCQARLHMHACIYLEAGHPPNRGGGGPMLVPSMRRRPAPMGRTLRTADIRPAAGGEPLASIHPCLGSKSLEMPGHSINEGRRPRRSRHAERGAPHRARSSGADRRVWRMKDLDSRGLRYGFTVRVKSFSGLDNQSNSLARGRRLDMRRLSQDPYIAARLSRWTPDSKEDVCRRCRRLSS
jgi:hypothetical protein